MPCCAPTARSILCEEKDWAVRMWKTFASGRVILCAYASKENWLSRGMLPLVLHDAVLAGKVEATRPAGADRLRSHHPGTTTLDRSFPEQGHEVEMAEADEVPAARQLCWSKRSINGTRSSPVPVGKATVGGRKRQRAPASRRGAQRLQHAPGDRGDISPRYSHPRRWRFGRAICPFLSNFLSAFLWPTCLWRVPPCCCWLG